jgi:GNAT superfamily N-acetyltransferase
MQLIRGYFLDDALRAALNALTRRTFGFDFEKWFQAGGYTGDYVPYCLEADGRILSNASANIMRFRCGAQERTYIQIGTVMTDPAFRGRGYARSLIERILSDYAGKADGFYLFGDLSAQYFYDKLGFQRGMQYRYTLKPDWCVCVCGKPFESAAAAGPALLAHYRQCVKNGVGNAMLDQINRFGLQMFYTAGMEQVYYSQELDCFACLKSQNGVLYLNSVISPRPVALRAVLERLPMAYQTLILGFAPLAPDCALFDARPYDGQEDYRFFYQGGALRQIEAERLFFPVFSHA